MMNATIWAAVAAILFYVLAIVAVSLQMTGKQKVSRGPVLIPGALAVLLHFSTLPPTLLTEDGVRLGLFPVASLIAATGSAIIILAGAYRRHVWISAIIFPFSALTILPAITVKSGFLPQHLEYGIGAHVLTSIVAYAVLAVAAAQASLITIQHRQLKGGHIRGVMRLFPPLQTMENMLFDLLWVGTLLLSIAIGLGFLYVEDLFEQHLAHKTILTLISWLCFATLLAGHHFLGWRSRTAARMAMISFGILIVAFFGSQLVLEFILGPTPVSP